MIILTTYSDTILDLYPKYPLSVQLAPHTLFYDTCCHATSPLSYSIQFSTLLLFPSPKLFSSLLY